MILVLAKNQPQAKEWARKEGLSPRDAHPVGSPAAAQGCRPTHAVVLPGFFERADSERILDVVRTCMVKMPVSPGEIE